ncbi:MAG: putative ribosomal N-acetyltransferase YdaF [Candidatus Heimdallarchaeota archaeon LC_2]|nr:MAG: putative ribosomal N-acetyltransferase YdaF [Candidatus Heimdallarchaeota archaeon LC_2]
MYYGTKTILRGLELSDVDDIMENWNDVELRQFLFAAVPHSKEQEIDFIKQSWTARAKGIGYVLAITDLDGKFLGICGLESINSIHRSATLGIAIHAKENWGKGYGTDAMITLCAFGFQIVNLNRIELDYHDFNIRAEKSYPIVGFKEIGRRRKAHFVLGQYHDTVIMDLLKSEFDEKYPSFDFKQKE